MIDSQCIDGGIPVDYWHNLAYGTGILLFCLFVCLVGASELFLITRWRDHSLYHYRSLCQNIIYYILPCNALSVECDGEDCVCVCVCVCD